jgi:hypothetical protein
MDSQGAKSVMSNDMKELTQGKEGIGAEIRGHKANLSNPSSLPPHSFLLCAGIYKRLIRASADTSQASKEHSKEVIDQLGGDDTLQAHRDKPISKSAAEELEGTRAAAA